MSALSEEQEAAVQLVREHRLVIITGPPGSGKTKLISAICDLDPEGVLLLAPTGSAAERLAGCSARPAMTLDKVDMIPKGDNSFQNRLTVVDEAGMVSLGVLERIFRFIIPSKLVLVGDPKQLPCIDGFPSLHTLLQCPSIPCMRLTKKWRRHGRPIGALDIALDTLGTPSFDLKKQDDSFRVIICNTEIECYDRAVEDYTHRPSQMLAYRNADVLKLNEMTEDAGRKHVHGRTRVGDRVVCLENVYEKNKTAPRMLVSNGVCGTAKANSVVYDNGYTDSGFKTTKFVPCRAMTVHKSQGNEYEVHGIVVVVRYGGGSVPIELMYTAISRFKSSCAVYITKRMVQSVFFGEGFKAAVDWDKVMALEA